MALPQIDIDGIKMLTEYKPAVNNLFSVYIFDSETGSGDTLSNYSPYHATGFTFGEETFDFKRHPVSKVMFLGSEGLKRVDEFSITWRESEDWRVKRYHEAWIGQFYNKEEDHFWSYPVNGDGSTPKLGKKFRIVFPYSQKNAAMNFDNGSFSPNTSNLPCLELNNVYPKGTGSLNMNWSKSAGIITYDISYAVESWKWTTYNPTNPSILSGGQAYNTREER